MLKPHICLTFNVTIEASRKFVKVRVGKLEGKEEVTLGTWAHVGRTISNRILKKEGVDWIQLAQDRVRQGRQL